MEALLQAQVTRAAQVKQVEQEKQEETGKGRTIKRSSTPLPLKEYSAANASVTTAAPLLLLLLPPLLLPRIADAAPQLKAHSPFKAKPITLCPKTIPSG